MLGVDPLVLNLHIVLEDGVDVVEGLVDLVSHFGTLVENTKKILLIMPRLQGSR